MLNRTRAACAPARSAARKGRYLLDAHVGFLLRVAMPRHTAIFMARMHAGLTQTQPAAVTPILNIHNESRLTPQLWRA